MKYAILAAGDGSRLMQEGELTPKPLVKVGGEALIDRLLRVFMANDGSCCIFGYDPESGGYTFAPDGQIDTQFDA